MAKLVLLFAALICISVVSAENKCSIGDTYTVTWNVEDDHVIFDIEAKTTGWIGLGFSKTPNMGDSELVIGSVESDGTKKIKNYHGTAPSSQPTEDPENKRDWKIVAGELDGDSVKMKYSRLVKAGGDSHGHDLTGKLHMLMSYGGTTEFGIHKDRGTCEVNFGGNGGESGSDGGSGSGSSPLKILETTTSVLTMAILYTFASWISL